MKTLDVSPYFNHLEGAPRTLIVTSSDAGVVTGTVSEGILFIRGIAPAWPG